MRPRAPAPKQSRIKNDYLANLRRRIAQSPQSPGIYRWKDEHGTVLYVGKAKNLRNRLRSYVTDTKSAQGPWKQSFLEQIADFEVTVTNTELEALIFETNLIKELKPKYNVLMKDGKNYIYARVTVQDPYPRVEAARRIDPRDGAKYFGPMSTGGELWTMLTILRKLFPFRTCHMSIEPSSTPGPSSDGGGENSHNGTFLPLSSGEGAGGRGNNIHIPLQVICIHKDRPTPCLDYHIGACSAPCIGLKTPEEYRRESIDGVLRFLKGDYQSVEDLLKIKMQQASLEKKFEVAAQLRDQLLSLQRMGEKQLVTDTSGEDSDTIAVAVLSGRADVCVLQRRNGRLIGDSCFSLSGRAQSASEVLEQFIPQYYEDGLDIPELIVVSEGLADAPVLAEWLKSKRGGKVRLLLPERGRKSHLLQLAEKNVQEKARQRELKWETEKRNTENALKELQEVLRLPAIPHRIECPALSRIEGYDISHLGGTETVGSMSVAIQGKAGSDQYRSFTIRTMKEGEVDDYRALREVLTRRLRRLTEDLPEEEKRWKEKGITFGRALKKEQKIIEETHAKHPADISNDGIDRRDYFVARERSTIVAFARFVACPEGKIRIVRSVWVAGRWRGQRLGQFLVRKILRGIKKGKIYVHAKSSLEEYYAEIGFRCVITPPKVLQEKLERTAREQHTDAPGIIMMWDAAQNRIDPSLSSRPDLLVIDGGKGQLGVAVDVLHSFHLSIPVIGLAKREEEVFLPGRSDPVTFPADSPAKFLLMRLRDEAHRFANRHRERRGTKHAKASALDAVPGIGEKTKRELLKHFGSVAGIREASDDQLREIVGPMLVRQVRKYL
ncbi:GNAT family N-acetyltransferase [Candidatus Peregrinibacteria bacterium]|nr:GNAT family N-acetyltransferase [Candidatus Peregrinibacteria bacterium]MBI3815918.1 GNAT family N-acetyltransferase [Candidatus Peregrinibacteria bacterium]